MLAKARDRQTNVIAFPQARKHMAIRCEESTRIAICSHCGGPLAEGESEDDCSSARITNRRKEPANA